MTTDTDPYSYKDTDIVVRKPAGLKVLYFCPATMLGNVERELKQWAPYRQTVILGAQPKATRRFLLGIMAEASEYVVIANYEMWRRDSQLIDDLIDIEFDTCIIDEAHNIKDRSTSAYKGIKRIITESHGGQGIPFVIPMTGTPILNKPQELFSLLTLVDPKHFYNESYFLQDFCQQDYDGKWSFKPGGIESLSKKIGPYFLRRTKEDAGIVLPPKTITIHELEVDEEAYPNQASARTQMRTWGSIMLDPDQGKAITAAAAIAVYTRLRQIETWPAGIKVTDPKTKEIIMQVDVYESQKIDYVIKQNGTVEGLLPEVVSDERVVIFSQFKEPLREIKRRCDAAGIKAVILDGDTPDDIRNEIAVDFDNRYTSDRSQSNWDVVLCNYRVGGIGLNFTAATQMIVLDEEWNPGKRDQAYDRIHRMGQDKPVTIHVLRDKFKTVTGAWGGIDVWLAGIIARKEEVVDEFNEATDIANDGYNALKSGLI